MFLVQGGKEHGVPIIVSEVHPSLPAARSGGLFVGDAILAVNGINLRDAKHQEAVSILSQQVCFLYVFFFLSNTWSRLTEELGHNIKGTAGERGNANSRVEAESKQRWTKKGYR